jgi:hypothetical protein
LAQDEILGFKPHSPRKPQPESNALQSPTLCADADWLICGHEPSYDHQTNHEYNGPDVIAQPSKAFTAPLTQFDSPGMLNIFLEHQ